MCSDRDQKSEMAKGEGLILLEEEIEELNPDENEIYKILGCEQADIILMLNQSWKGWKKKSERRSIT